METKKFFLLANMLMVAINFYVPCHAERSIFRENKENRWLETYWKTDDEPHYKFYSHFIEEWAVFKRYDRAYLQKHSLPNNAIPYRSNESKSIPGTKLKESLETLVQQVLKANGQTEFPDFKILKKRDFNFQRHSGVIILLCKNYPFVIKLFIENPKSFTKPFNKGFEPALFFFMAGGCSRYLAGFTRIKNLEEIKKHIDSDPEWSQKIKTPRKWYWEPKNNKYFTVTGHNIGGKKIISQNFPSIYAIICDAIDIEDTLYNVPNAPAKTVDLVHFLGNRIDPHTENFVVEKDTNMITLIDTEHFPSIVGLRSELYFDNYFRWYRDLAWKFVDDRFCRDKMRRKKIQHYHIPKTLHV